MELMENLGATASIYVEGFVWFIALDGNGLFRFNTNDGQISFVGLLPNDSCKKDSVFGDCICLGDRLIFFPLIGDRIVEYDIQSNLFNDYRILQEIGNSEYADRVIMLKDKVYLFPLKAGGNVLEYNTVTKCVRRDEFFENMLSDFGGSTISVRDSGEEIVLTLCEERKVFVIDKNEKRTRNYSVKTDKKPYFALLGNNLVFIILRDSFDIIVIDTAESTQKIYRNEIGKYAEGRNTLPYADAYYNKGLLYVCNYYGESTYVLNTINGKFESVGNTNIFKKWMEYGPAYCRILKFGNDLIFVPWRGEYIVVYNKEYERMFECKGLSEQQFEQRILYEGRIELKDFCEII